MKNKRTSKSEEWRQASMELLREIYFQAKAHDKAAFELDSPRSRSEADKRDIHLSLERAYMQVGKWMIDFYEKRNLELVRK